MATILFGTAIGVLAGHKIREQTRTLVTQSLGLITLLVAGTSAAAITDPVLAKKLPDGSVILIVIAAVLLGAIIGSALQIELRLSRFADWLRTRFTPAATEKKSASVSSETAALDSAPATDETDEVPDLAMQDARARFIDGFLTASLVFCIGPLAILGALQDGLGDGIEQLGLKAILDGFASIAFAASLGWSVAASAISVGLFQGILTILGWAVGGLLAAEQIAVLNIVGGVLLVGVSLRLLRIGDLKIGNLLPALILAPIFTWGVASIF